MCFHNLDAILSIGCRVKLKRGTQFRIWATHVLRDHLLQGYSVNERRLSELKSSLYIVVQVRHVGRDNSEPRRSNQPGSRATFTALLAMAAVAGEGHCGQRLWLAQCGMGSPKCQRTE